MRKAASVRGQLLNLSRTGGEPSGLEPIPLDDAIATIRRLLEPLLASDVSGRWSDGEWHQTTS